MTKMKKILLTTWVFMLFVMNVSADEPQKFSPEKFQADMEQFITQEAGLTTDEASKFFPLFREMQQKQRVIFKKMKKECGVKAADDAGCKKCVQKRDAYELELKKIQQSYHNKFFSVISASKVYDVLKAEERFHRRTFKNWGQGRRNMRGHQR